MPPPLVLIEWEDSAQPIAGWAFLEGMDDWQIVKCQSVGWLIHDGKHVKALAPNLGDTESENSAQVSGVIRIPARCVVKMTRLTPRS